ncbi:MAG: hypothetical protein KKB88_04395 [Nanoarchaeota archaeon]|nr:hypothetical protein [Nanoarchaeota archaeon]
MYKLINFAVKLMEKQNMQDPKLLPSQNPEINPSQNPEINPDQNPDINSSQNPDINPTQNPNWKQNQWDLFEETILWSNLNEDQRAMCKRYLKSL